MRTTASGSVENSAGKAKHRQQRTRSCNRLIAIEPKIDLICWRNAADRVRDDEPMMLNTEKSSRRGVAATSSPSLGFLSINDGQDSRSNFEAKAGLMWSCERWGEKFR